MSQTTYRSPFLARRMVALASTQRRGGGVSGDSGVSIWGECIKDG